MSKFATPSGLVITTRHVMYEGWPILTVAHEADDESWQFVNGWGDTDDSASAVLVHAQHVIDLDPSILPLADLPLGWQAWRRARNDPWTREPIPENPLRTNDPNA